MGSNEHYGLLSYGAPEKDKKTPHILVQMMVVVKLRVM